MENEYTSEAGTYSPLKVSGARYASVPPAALVFVREVAAAVEVPLKPTARPKSATLAVSLAYPPSSCEKSKTLALLMSWWSMGCGFIEWQ